MTTSPAAALAALRWANKTPAQRKDHCDMMRRKSAENRKKRAKQGKCLRKQSATA